MHCSLDTIGIAGFGHDFQTLDGHPSAVIDAFEAFGDTRQGIASQLVLFAASAIPLLQLIPTTRITLFKKLAEVTTGVAKKMLGDEQIGMKMNGDSVKETSILGLLGERFLIAQCVTHIHVSLFSEGRICHCKDQILK
jgi:hypothetical protein